jgi:hypothetical protein
VAELEDVNILAGVDEAERVKLADMDANVAVYVLVNVSGLHARAIPVKIFAVRNVVIDVDVNVRYQRQGHNCIYFIISVIFGYYKN